MKFCAILLMVGATICLVTCVPPPDILEQIREGRRDWHTKPLRRPVVQLCETKPTLDCVKDYFSQNSEGEVVSEENGSTVRTENLPVYLPFLGLTVVTTVVHLSNMVGEVQEFYKDINSGNVVLAVKFDGLKCEAPDSIFAIARDGLEPKVFVDYVQVTYPVILTVVIPLNADGQIDKKSLEQASYSGYLENPNPDFTLGLNFIENNDPIVQKTLAALLSNIPLALKEIFRLKAQYYGVAYIQNSIANFNLPLSFEEYDTSILLSGDGIDSDNEEYFEELCANEDVTTCVQNYFGERSSCAVQTDPDDGPVFRKIFSAYIPAYNTTAVSHDSELKVSNGEITRFYLNKQTGNIVIVVDFPEGAILDSPAIDIIISRPGQLPKIATDDILATYPVRITAVISGGDNFSADKIRNSYVSSKFIDTPTIVLGPKLVNNKDPQVKELITHHNPVTVAKEALTTEAYSMFVAYFQKYICDFDLPVEN